MTTPSITLESRDAVLVVRFDDGRANALCSDSLDRLDEALDRSAAARAVCLLGRPGFFCAGYDLEELRSGVEQARVLGKKGRSFLHRLASTDVPTVAAVSGHALGAGAALMLACDFRIGCGGPFRIGLNELAKGMAVSELTVELAVRRLVPAAVEKAILGAEVYGPEQAVQVGYLDSVVEAAELESAAVERAQRLAGIDPKAMRVTKSRIRAARLATGEQARS